MSIEKLEVKKAVDNVTNTKEAVDTGDATSFISIVSLGGALGILGYLKKKK